MLGEDGGALVQKGLSYLTKFGHIKEEDARQGDNGLSSTNITTTCNKAIASNHHKKYSTVQ